MLRLALEVFGEPYGAQLLGNGSLPLPVLLQRTHIRAGHIMMDVIRRIIFVHCLYAVLVPDFSRVSGYKAFDMGWCHGKLLE